MVAQARGFCNFGAKAITWYAWDDGGNMLTTHTPNNSPTTNSGIAAGIEARRQYFEADVSVLDRD